MNAFLVAASLAQFAILTWLIRLSRALTRQTEANLEAQACRMDRIENDLARVGGHVANYTAALDQRVESTERSIVALTKDTEAHVKSATGHVRASQEIANRLVAIELQIKGQRHS